jgi:alpha-acetolactate decarboxylase
VTGYERAHRSGELGLGPFGGGSFELVVRDGKIVNASQYWEIEKFSPQVWEPFAKWVSTAHAEDAAVMYTAESHTNVRLTEESIRLWELRTREYVEEVGR